MIKINAKGLGKWAKHIEKDINRQVPYLFKRVVDESAFLVKKDLDQLVTEKVEDPTPFTKRAWRVKKATKANVTATIRLNAIQAQYLQSVIEGGTRRPDGRFFAVGFNVKKNKYGNFPAKKKITALLNRPDTFIAEIRGVNGIWKRKGRTIKLLFGFEKSLNYNDPKMPMSLIESRTFRTVSRNAPRIIQEELNKIIPASRVFRS